MARNCLVCGREVSGGGIVCSKCDKPKKSDVAPATSKSLALDPFPAAPVVKFPVEATTPAITSIVDVLVATGSPAILLGTDRSVKFVSDAALRLFETPQSELSKLSTIETAAGIRIGDLAVPASSSARVRGRNVVFSLVPMSGGASGAVLIFRDADPLNESQASFVSYVRDTVLDPIKSLRDALRDGDRGTATPLIEDAAATLDQILSSLEMAPGLDLRDSDARPVPRVIDVVRRVADRFVPIAEMKGVQLQVDVQEFDERFVNHEGLSDALAIMMDNALHYVPAAGMVVIGARWMEQKNKPLLLFFVMDNGPLVPEHLRQALFEPSFTWNPAGERSGRGLFKCREFAVQHGGSVWVESKTGKACTFFLRVRPDGTA